MPRRLPALLVLLVLIAGCAGVGPTPTPAGNGRRASVTRVVDGDTLHVRFGDGSTDTVRLLGVDTPETHAANQPTEYEGVPDTAAGRRCLKSAGEDATAYTRTLVGNRTVRVATDPAADRRGDYGRLLAYVVLPNGTVLNDRLVATGRARVYDSTFSRSDRYYAAEADAQAADRGLWQCRGAANATARSALAVVAVHADAAGPDGTNLDDEYVVFGNRGDATLHLAGWAVRDRAGHRYTFGNATALAPNATLTLHTGAGADDNGSVYWGADGPVWNNGGDTVVVTNATGAVVIEHRFDG